jgi:hypothetical protein
MTDSTIGSTGRRDGIRRFTPRAGQRVQLFSAAAMWAVGATILLVRGVGFLHDSWFAALLALAVALGVTKSHYLLDRVARKAVVRIHDRGRACYFGFFSWKSWMFVAVMMGGGILLRNSGLPRDFLAVLYVGVGTGLVLADRIFWQALVSPAPAIKPDSRGSAE